MFNLSNFLGSLQWRFSLYSGRFESTDKHTLLPVRPIMMIRLNKEEQNRK